MTTPHPIGDADAADPGRERTDSGAVGTLAHLGSPGHGRVRGWLVPAMVVVTVLMLIAAVTVVVLARRSVGAQEARLDELRAQQAADAELSAAGADAGRPDLDVSALRTQLDAVRAADRAVDAAVATWRQGGAQLKIVWESVGRCMYEVDQYDQSAGWFTAEELGDLPVSIDLTAAASDCGQATLTKNAKGADF